MALSNGSSSELSVCYKTFNGTYSFFNLSHRQSIHSFVLLSILLYVLSSKTMYFTQRIFLLSLSDLARIVSYSLLIKYTYE